MVNLTDHTSATDEGEDAIEDFEDEENDVIMDDLPEKCPATVLDKPDDEPTGEVPVDIFKVFGILQITGNEGDELVTGPDEENAGIPDPEIFLPEMEPVHVDDMPTVEENKANEESILEFLAGIAEYQREIAEIEGDVVEPEDLQTRLRWSPIRVIDDYYHNGKVGLGIWGLQLRNSHTLACVRMRNRNCFHKLDHSGAHPVHVYPCAHPHAMFHICEECLILDIVKRSYCRDMLRRLL